MSATVRRALAAATLCVAVLASTAGCGFTGLYSANLPGSVGGPFSSAKTFTMTVIFDNVLDLVPQSAVKVNDVTVGTVESVALVNDPATHAYKAKVTCKVERSVHLPANSVAILQETSLLGEKYVQLQAPTAVPSGRLGDGAVIRDGATKAYPDVEQVFGVLSSVLNGGGLEKLQTINVELNAALAGREDKVRDVLVQLNTFVGGLDTQKTEITRAITSLDKLSGDLRAQNSTIVTALHDLGPGIKVIADERADLVALLQGLSRLGVVSTRVINASVTDTKADLQLLEPVLSQLNKAGTALPGSLELLLDYPFPRHSTDGILGDDTNLTASIDAKSVCQLNAQLAPLCTVLNVQKSPLPGNLCQVLPVPPGVCSVIPPLTGAVTKAPTRRVLTSSQVLPGVLIGGMQ